MMTPFARVALKFKFVWDRITFSRLTTIYFAFSVIHFILQLSLQIRAFTINAKATSFLTDIVQAGNATDNTLPFQSGSIVRLCSWVPSNIDVDVESCHVVWNGTANNAGDNLSNAVASSLASALPSSSLSPTVNPSPTSLTSSSSLPTLPAPLSLPPNNGNLVNGPETTPKLVAISTTTIFVQAVPTAVKTIFTNPKNDNGDDGYNEHLLKRDALSITSFHQGNQTKVTVTGLDGHGSTTLDDTCLWALHWPVSTLGNTKREDIVFIAFQFWVLGMSLVALLNESMPHILASLLTHMMATAWAAFQITHTANFRSNFNQIITNGACRGVALLPHFWEARREAEISSLALHIVALLVSCFLTWKLIKLFGWQTFKRVGASLTINRVYKIVLLLSIAIQLSLFFMIVTVSLWIDQLLNSVIGDLVDFQKLYKVSSFITLALLGPWLMIGWFAVRRELRLPMFFFLVLSILYLAAWGVMFFSTTFRWTFITWQFFSVMASASVILTCVSFVLGVVCRFNFGKGLLRYLNGQQSLGDDDYSVYDEKADIEKFCFPSGDTLVPTYLSTTGPEVAFTNQTLGPRFFNSDKIPFEKAPATPVPAVTRNLTAIPQVQRSNSNGSSKSSETLRSFYSYSQGDGTHSRSGSQISHSKRWVIE